MKQKRKFAIHLCMFRRKCFHLIYFVVDSIFDFFFRYIIFHVTHGSGCCRYNNFTSNLPLKPTIELVPHVAKCNAKGSEKTTQTEYMQMKGPFLSVTKKRRRKSLLRSYDFSNDFFGVCFSLSFQNEKKNTIKCGRRFELAQMRKHELKFILYIFPYSSHSLKWVKWKLFFYFVLWFLCVFFN